MPVTTSSKSSDSVILPSQPEAAERADIAARRRALYMAFLVAGVFFMENLDGTVIATALPQMARTFHTSPVDLNIGITAYLLTLAVFIPISGWVADRWGARKVFGTAICVFTLSSILCGLCNGLWTFTAARILQGIGGAMMVPVGRLVVLRNTEKSELMRAIAYIMWPGLAAPVIGPPLGGVITEHISWRWIFYLNVPLGLIALALTFWLIPVGRASEPKPFDLVGFLLSGSACVALMYGLDLIGRQPTPWGECAVLIAIAAALGVWAIRHLKQAPHPLFDLTSLQTRTFAVTIWGGSLFRIAIGAMPFLLPLLFQLGFGLSPAASGLLVLWVFAGNLGMKPATTPVLKRFGFRSSLIGNGLLAAATIFACAFLTPNTPRLLIAAILFAGGLCRSMQFTSLNTMSFADIRPERMSGANALYSTVGQLTFGMGVAFGAVALRIGAIVRGEHAAQPSLVDFRIAFLLVGLISVAAVLDCFALLPDAGAEVSRHTRYAKG